MAHKCLDGLTDRVLKKALPESDDPHVLLGEVDDLIEIEDLRLRQKKIQGVVEHRWREHLKSYAHGADKAFMDMMSGGPRSAGLVPLERRIDSIIGQYHSQLVEHMTKYRPRYLGLAHSKQGQRNIILELFGTKTGDHDAAEFAKAFSSVAEDIRNRFNIAGGGIRKLTDWRVVTNHDPVKINKSNYDEWRATVLDNIDIQRTKQAMGIKGLKAEDAAARFENALEEMYENLRTDGLHKIDPGSKSPWATSKIGSRHQEHRILHFKNGDGWMAYQDKFGSPDYYNAMMGYIELMSREIGAMEMLGPSPDQTIRMLRESVMKDMGKRNAGQWAENTYNQIMGKTYGPNNSLADTFRALRNIETATKIGSAMLSAIADIGFAGLTARFNGVPIFKTYLRSLRSFNPTNLHDKKLAARFGLMADFAINRATAINRMSEVTGYGATAKWADATVRASGLNHWTLTAKNSFQLEFLSSMADMTNRGWDDMTPRMRAAFERYGIDAADWNKIKSSALYEQRGVKFVDPQSFNDNELTAKVVGMILEETSYAVPEPNAKVKSLMNLGTQTGTIHGEIIRSMGQFKSFGVSVMLSHLGRGLSQKGFAKLRYLGSMVAGTTMLGAIGHQAKEISKGRTPKSLDDPSFWASAFAEGGSGGFLVDFLFMDTERFGGSLAGTVFGPLYSDVDQIAIRFLLGSAQDVAALEKDVLDKITAGGAKAAGKFIPGNLWYTRLAIDRYIRDNLDQLADPNWRTRQRRIRKKMRREHNQTHWWKPGEGITEAQPEKILQF